MRSLFAKILLWFLATVMVAFMGFSVIAVRHYNDPMRQPPMARAIRFQAREAVEAYETGGVAALRWDLARVQEIFQSEAMLADAKGRDLVTGEDRSELIAAGRVRPFWPHNRAVVARKTENGRYWFILTIPGEALTQGSFPAGQVYVLGGVVLLYYLLARYLTRPLRKLQTALERFGQGDLSARAGSTRRDELGHLARTFDQMAERIQKLVASERRLLLDISHELRSPLARLNVATELARSGENRDAALDRIQKESDRLNALVGELLQATRIEVDPQALRAQPVRLDDLLAAVVSDCSIEAAVRGSSLKLDAPGPVTVSGDAELLRRAAENVIRNAIRYAPRETAVEVHLVPGGAVARIQVRDYGPGVPEEALSRIFDPFYRVEGDRNRDSGGVGLGLAIARRAVDLHKGKMHARNMHPGLLVEMEFPAGAQ
ncbi:MAG: HAMP domain-containing protein [Acidobacteriia bacterium]|nr:HAMP domain-containing protein [Terriglobia bacterium]